MNARRRHVASTLLVAALLLSAAVPALSNQGNGGGKPDDPGKPGGVGRNGNDNARGKRNPTRKVQGSYGVKIAGYYKGTGDVKVSGDGISIQGTVTDPRGNSYTLSSDKLEVLEDRFRGGGTLGSMTVTIDGRVDPEDVEDPDDPEDKNKKRVLKKGRVTFTFSTNTQPSHRARGAGELH